MLHVSTWSPIRRNYCPAIFQSFRMVRPKIDHWFDRKDVALLNLWPFARLSVIWNLRILMHLTANSVSHVVAHDGIAMGFGVRLNGRPYITDVVAIPALFYSQPQAFFGYSN